MESLQTFQPNQNLQKLQMGKMRHLLTKVMEDSEEDEDDDEELALMVKKLKKMATKAKINKFKKQFKNPKPSKAKKLNFKKKSNGEDEENKDVIYDDECEQEYANICLMVKSDSESSSDEEDEVSNSNIPEAVSNYIDELISVNKTAFKKISELKKETQQDDSATENPASEESDKASDELAIGESNQNQRSDEIPESSNQENNEESSNLDIENNERFNKNWKHKSSHRHDLIIGSIDEGIKTRAKAKEVINSLALISEVEPKNIDEALKDESWIEAMQEELLQFKINQIWELVPRPKNHLVIGIKWVILWTCL
ncbi:uncharacterized protein LOC115686712 [Syzygium oleosum]|uniref:uncharacterized protein LOC115686712 n=1 Tax=Syzygium oleosum TaxID=219896 RepID=UPI0011D1CC16|nr:uncharacterized protein LOC115686712 [Syzygium oleosum]